MARAGELDTFGDDFGADAPNDIWDAFLDDAPNDFVAEGFDANNRMSRATTDVVDDPVSVIDVPAVSEDTVDQLCAVLAVILERDHVAPLDGFFDELGADSLLMAQFCAELRNRDDVPSPSIRDVYGHPSVAALVDHWSSADEPIDAADLVFDRVPPKNASEPPASRSMYAFIGVLQAVTLLAIPTGIGYALALGFSWLAAAEGAWNSYERSLVFGAALLVGLSALPVVAKWLLIGRWKAERIPLWTLRHFRFWLVTTLVKFSPMLVFAGSPVFVFWLRALGANIGRNVVYLSRQVPVCTDLLTVGDGAIVRADAIIKCYSASDGHIEIGPVTIGNESVVGVGSILDIHSSLGDRSQLGHSSTLVVGQHVPADMRLVGTPARQHTELNFADVEPRERQRSNRFAYSIAQVALLVFVSLPFSTLLAFVLFRAPFSPTSPESTSVATSILEFSAIVYFGSIAFALSVALTVPRLFARVFEPGVAYPLYGVRYGLHRLVSRISNVPFLTKLLGDSSYIVHYLYALGYGLKLSDQTGSNFGTSVRHDSPYFLSVGGGTMVADGIVFANSEFSNTSFRLGSVALAEQSYFGNNLIYPPQGKTSTNCLVGTKTVIPLDGEKRENTGILGNPSFEIPRIVDRDLDFADDRHGERFREQLRRKNRHNRHSIALYLATRFVAIVVGVGFATLAITWFSEVGALGTAILLPAAVAVAWAYNIGIERLLGFLQPMQPTMCSMYERPSWRVERYWKLTWNPAVLNGTAMKTMAWRLLGVDIGRQVFDDGCVFTERTMISVGDYCTLNSATVLQAHSQEDAAFKADRVTVGRHCTLGTGAFVHYGTNICDGVTIETNAFVMKGTTVPEDTWWGENPARDVTPTTATPEENDHLSEKHESEQVVPPTTIDREIETHDIVEGEMTMTITSPTSPDVQRWRQSVDRAGLTPLPCLTNTAINGIAHVDVPIDKALAKSISKTAKSLDVTPTAIFLAAHARVVAALTGEDELTVGYSPVAAASLPIVFDLSEPTWQSLIEQAHAHSITLDAHHEEGLAALDDAGFSRSLFQTVFRPALPGEEPTMHDGVALLATTSEPEGKVTLSLRLRLDTIDAGAADRIVGYHRRALELLVDDVSAEHASASLLTSDEVDFQLNDLAGPVRDLPNLRFHELFELRVDQHPDDIAVLFNGTSLTYRELNGRANQLARALLARGAKPESVVGVVTERNLEWITAVLAIFKIGAAYLPIEPHFPADRIASMLERSQCRLVVSEPGSTATLYGAMRGLPRVKGFFAATGLSEGRSECNLDISVRPDQLAYIYFTSGSTGQPKGAMCEHLGMLNHLYAKIDDLTIVEGDVVAQIAPQCFDISLWQLVSALLVGGRTVIIDQDTLLDPELLIRHVVEHEIGVLQVVPSYLEVLLSHLEANPTWLGSLHCVSVTGEALSIELARRWFEVLPDIELVNAYGLTETSDDTNHEVMNTAPLNGRVPLGPAVNNVSVRVVDPNLSLVPLGAPGEIVFSGMCVGRGYINDPERTAAAFVDDPYVDGERLYRSGDFGRWDAEGKLEFLGRRDAQVKIRGFRIEIGDIENALLRIEGVRQGAVVITSRGDGVKQLIAFYSGTRFQPGQVQDELRSTLPDYMVPSAVHFEDELPLSDNGKIDRKVLRALAADREVIDLNFVEPETPTETRLAQIWSELLEIPVEQIGRHDHFFDRGANSLSAVELVTRVDRVVSLRDVTKTPVLAEMATLIDEVTNDPEITPRGHELLQMLSSIEHVDDRPIICFPYAGGNAINYQAMASALQEDAFSVYAVDFPGHDVGSTRESFRPLDAVVEQVVHEVKEKNLSDVVLWGHSSGSAFALQAADKLAAEGVNVERVFVGAQVVGSVESHQEHADALAGQADVDIARELADGGGYGQLAGLSDDQAGFVGAAYRHDVNEAHQWFIDRLAADQPPKIHAPVVAVVADDDRFVSNAGTTPEDWAQLADAVDVVHIDTGGHYFLRTQPDAAAAAILAYAAHTWPTA